MKKLVLVASLAALLAPVAAGASAPPQDEQWLQTSISGDRFEIRGGQIALQRALSPQVRALGQRLVKDHSKSLHDAIALAQKYGIGVPPAATPSEQWELNRIKNMPRSWFDGQYTALEIKDHNQDIEETGFEARKGEQWEIREEARKDLPMLNMHLRLAKAAAESLSK